MQISFSRGLSTGLIVLGVVLGGIQVWQHQQAPFIQEALAPELVTPAAVPILDPSQDAIAVASFSATLSAQAVYVMDLNSASTLLAKEPARTFFPASTAKMMTALVARQQYPLDAWLPVPPQATAAGTVIGLRPGQAFTTADLLKGLLITSGNDAAEVLAFNDPGGREAFIQRMNALSKQLHLQHTAFTNPSGLDDYRQQTTARDLTILAKEIVNDDFLASVVSSQSAVLTDQYSNQVPIYTTNYLLRFPEYEGIKTGTTELAGEVLITKVEVKGHPLLITIMKSEDRYADTQLVVEWLRSYYNWVPIEELRAE